MALARQQNHYGLYINAVEDGTYLDKHHADWLGKVKLGSASIAFRTLDRVVLAEPISGAADSATPPDPVDDR